MKNSNTVIYERTLLHPIERAALNQQNVRISLTRGGHLFVLGKTGRYYQVGCEATDLAVASDKEIRVEVMAGGPLSQADHSRQLRDLSELKWTLAYHLFDGSLPEDCLETDVVQLTRWPNFTRLPHSQHCYRIAALLQSRPTTVVMACRILNIPREEVCRFYTAARRAGYVRLVNRQVEVQPLKPHRQGAVMQALLKRLGVN